MMCTHTDRAGNRDLAPRSTLLGVVLFLLTGPWANAQWPQWGGPNRDFTVETSGLADKWPDGGPPRLWYRELGDGYSSISVDDGVLYTMYRRGDDEFSVALDAKNGSAIWEHRHPSPFTEAMAEFGPGPHSTPLVSGPRLFTIGTNAVLHCFDKKTGNVLWKHDLVRDFDGHAFHYGYACSPIAYQEKVITAVDRRRSSSRRHDSAGPGIGPATEKETLGQTLVAFDQSTGRPAWKSQDRRVDYSSPFLISVENQDQLVLLLNQGIMGVSPVNGTLLWHHPIPSHHGGNYSMPFWLGDDLLFVSSSHSKSRLVKLTKSGVATVPEEAWYSKKMGISHGNAVRFGDYLLGSSGRGQGPALLVALDIRTGERAWVERGFDTATFVAADGKLILLAEDGTLALLTLTPEDPTVHSTCRITEALSWAAPTLVGQTLYVRDRKHIMALDLGSRTESRDEPDRPAPP